MNLQNPETLQWVRKIILILFYQIGIIETCQEKMSLSGLQEMNCQSIVYDGLLLTSLSGCCKKIRTLSSNYPNRMDSPRPGPVCLFSSAKYLLIIRMD